MTSTFTAEPDSHENIDRPAREIPVLFHLMDVSRSRGKGKAAKPKVPGEPEAEPAAQPKEILSSAIGGPADSPEREPVLSTESSTEFCIPSTAPVEVASESQKFESPKFGPPTSEVPTESHLAVDTAVSTASHSPPERSAETPPSGESTVSPRDRAEQRRRQRQTEYQPSWFAAQGKYIAIGFAIALVGTIAIARMSKKSARPTSHTPHAHPGVAANANHQPAAELVIEMPAKDGQKAENPAKSVATEAAQSKGGDAPAANVELHTPQLSVPQLAETKSTDKPADAGLFPWPQRTEVRVAAQPTENHTLQTPPPASSPMPAPIQPAPAPGSSGPALAQPNLPGSLAPPPASAPELAQPYAPPVAATSPPAYGPELTNPAPAQQPLYPSTNYRSQYQPAASDPAGIGPVGPTGAPQNAPAPAGGTYYPTTNSASGYRYERTGSGLY
jgi:hypothetical protein